MKTKVAKPRVRRSARVAVPSLKRQGKTLLDLFKPFVGAVKDGPADLAANHKLYASGATKWK